jgi:hypothetical protein
MSGAVLTKVLCICGFLAAASAAVGQDPPVAERARGREQITAILQRGGEAWNTHDMRAFASLFHEDGTWILWTGAVWTGRAAV